MTRVLYLGMKGAFSIAPLETLIRAGANVCAVVMPATPSSGKQLPHRLEPPVVGSTLPVINPYLEPGILHLAWVHDIPVWEVGRPADVTTLDVLAAYQPDLIAVACFPYRLPPAVLQLPRHGCLNLHPSLLPAYRGPAPLFWMARQGERQAGLTLHFLDEGLDSGDIIAQTVLDWPEGSTAADLERRCAVAGGELLLAAIQQLTQGAELPRRAQPQEGSSYFPWPSVQDFLIPTHWEAWRAFNFLQAAANWPLVIEVDHHQFAIRVALSYDPNQSLGQPYFLEQDEVWVQFQPGVLRARIYA